MLRDVSMTTESIATDQIGRLELKLDHADPAIRKQILRALCELAARDSSILSDAKPVSNMHAHTFFSYNCYGYSPSRFAWLARRAGLEAAGIVDFDVLDGIEEFIEAGRTVGIKATVGIESRVYVPEFSMRVINSPGEPGIAYHMGAGLTSSRFGPVGLEFLTNMRDSASARNREIVKLVNAHLSPVELDYDRDIVPLTPGGNVTERHICLAYARKAAASLSLDKELPAFWSEKLGEAADKLDLPDGPKLQNLIRAKTMKQGGPGYVAPGKGSFPRMADMNRFILDAGGIPTITWLDGTSEGEKSINELFDTAAASGAAALNIIPDRNYKQSVKDKKLENLYAIVSLAEKRNFPVIVGTEMNSPGQKFVDSFESAELAPLAHIFIKGARIVYAHSVLQARGQMGYLSKWANLQFPDVRAKNDFFEDMGRKFLPSTKPDADPCSEAAQLNSIMMELVNRDTRIPK